MIVSVALCTYNGAQHIREQLESILDQTMKVDEIVVCDDGSTDNTLQIAEDIEKETSANIRIYRNENNLGVCANFQKAIELCKGEIIFLSDQDDLWLPDKVKEIVNYFDKNKDKHIVFSDGLLVNDDGNIIGDKTLWATIGFTPRAQKSLTDGYGAELFSYENRATGATMAVRRSFIAGNTFLDICNDTILHDGALAMQGIATEELGYIVKPLTKYRIHSKQAVGIGEALQKPVSDDARDTSPLCEQWDSMPLPAPFKERIALIRARHRMKHQPLGPFRMLNNIYQYRHFYNNHWGSFLLFDLRQWAGNMVHRIIH